MRRETGRVPTRGRGFGFPRRHCGLALGSPLHAPLAPLHAPRHPSLCRSPHPLPSSFSWLRGLSRSSHGAPRGSWARRESIGLLLDDKELETDLQHSSLCLCLSARSLSLSLSLSLHSLHRYLRPRWPKCPSVQPGARSWVPSPGDGSLRRGVLLVRDSVASGGTVQERLDPHGATARYFSIRRSARTLCCIFEVACIVYLPDHIST